MLIVSELLRQVQAIVAASEGGVAVTATTSDPDGDDRHYFYQISYGGLRGRRGNYYVDAIPDPECDHEDPLCEVIRLARQFVANPFHQLHKTA